MALGPHLSTIDLGAIFAAAEQSGRTGGRLLDLSDQLSGVQTRTTANWQGLAGRGFSVHLGTRVQAKQLTGQALQRKGSALSTYGTSLRTAVQQWESGRSLLSTLPAQLQSQALTGGALSVAGLGIKDPVQAAEMLLQAGAALIQLVEAQTKAQSAGLQLVEDLKGLQGLLDEAQSLLGGNPSQPKGAPVAPAEVPSSVVPVGLGLGAGGLGPAGLPDVIRPPKTEPGPDLWDPPIPIPGPDLWKPPIPTPGPDLWHPPKPTPGPDVWKPPKPTPGSDLPWPLNPLGPQGGSIVKDDPGDTSEGDGQSEPGDGGSGQGEPGRGDPTPPGKLPKPPWAPPGSTWRGPGEEGTSTGGWFDPPTGTTIHPHPDSPYHDPHYDVSQRGKPGYTRTYPHGRPNEDVGK